MNVTLLIYTDDKISNVNNFGPTSSTKHLITASLFRFLDGGTGYAMNTLLKFRYSIYMIGPCKKTLGELRTA